MGAGLKPLFLSAAHLQNLCDKSAARITSKQNKRRQREYQLFSRFCQAANIPLYPVTPALIKLCHFAKDGGKAPPTSSLTRALEKLVGVGKNLFRGKLEYHELCELSDELVGVEDDGSSIDTSVTINDEEEGLSTNTQTDEEDDASDGVCMFILGIAPCLPCSDRDLLSMSQSRLMATVPLNSNAWQRFWQVQSPPPLFERSAYVYGPRW